MVPEPFVARDRARRLAWRLEKVLQERRLAWRGSEIGMSTLSEGADAELAAIASDARASAEGVLAGTLRDRERGYMEIPFVVAMGTVAQRLETAAALEAGRRLRHVREDEGRRRVEAELTAALERLEAFQAAYDAKTPLPEARTVDLQHLLARLAPSGARPWDRPPPPMATDAHGLEDLLLAARAALHAGDAPWRVEPPAPGRPLALSLGEAAGPPGDVPPAVERAASVLEFRHPVAVTAVAAPDGGGAPGGLRLTLGAAEGDALALTLAALAGPAARLSEEAEHAVRTLTLAPPAVEGAPTPPERLVALLGLLRVLDAAVRSTLVPRLRVPALRMAVLDLPRERTRKAPLRQALVEDLERELEGFPAARLHAVTSDLAKGRWEPRGLSLPDAGVLLALLGRDVVRGAFRLPRAVDLEPLEEEEVAALAQGFFDVASVRRDLEAGREVPPAALTRLECAAIGVLGRLGRLA